MGRRGPCYHCGVNNTPLWRAGPPEKPVLCNACGSRWRLGKNLDGYVPKHAITDASSTNVHRLPSNLKNPFAMTTHSSSESSSSLQKTHGTEVQGPTWNTRRKRSNLQQEPSSLINTLHWQLQRIQQELEDENTSGHEEEDILIHKKWQYIPDSEIGLGTVLLKPPPAP